MRTTARPSTSRPSAATAAYVPPVSNTGGTERNPYLGVSERYEQIVMVNGKAKTIPLKRGVDTAGFIDTLAVVFKEDVFIRPDQLGTEEEVICNASAQICEIMGYGIGEEKNGLNGYKRSFLMGTAECKYGNFMIGGAKQKETVCFQFTGTGLTAALNGWETRLYEFMAAYDGQCHITRVDIAHDFLNGEYTCDMALRDWIEGGFTRYRNRPGAQRIGEDWLQFRGSGRTFQIGAKGGDLSMRFYEKGREQGDCDSPWVRGELQMRNKSQIIPLDVLIEPGKYLTGAYPATERIFSEWQEAPSRAEVKKKMEEISVEHVLKYASMQSSRSIVMLEDYGMTPEQIVEALKDGQTERPKRLRKEAFDCGHMVIRYIHERKHLPKTEEQVLDMLSESLRRSARREERIASRPVPPRKFRSMDDYLRDKARLENMAAVGFERLEAKAETLAEQRQIAEDRRCYVYMKAFDIQGKSNFEREAWQRYWQEQEERYYSRHVTPYEILNPDFSPIGRRGN